MAAGTSRPTKAAQNSTKTAPQQENVLATVRALNPVAIAETLLPVRSIPVQQLAFYCPVAGLAFAEIIETPVALLIVGGHLLHRSRNPIAESLGEALAEAG